MAVPKTAPIGAPAEKVENAKDRARDGGKASAIMPSCDGVNEWVYDDKLILQMQEFGQLLRFPETRAGYQGSSHLQDSY